MEAKEDLKNPIIWKNTKKAFFDVLNILKCGSCQSKDIQYILKCCKNFLCLICEEKIEICDKCKVEKSTVKLNDIDTTLKLCSDLSKLLRIKDISSAKDTDSNKDKTKIECGRILEPAKVNSITPKALPAISKKKDANKNLLTSIKMLNIDNVAEEKIMDDIISTDIMTPSSALSRKKQQRSVKRKLNSSFSAIDSYFNKPASPNNEISITKKVKTETESVLCKTPTAAGKSNFASLDLSNEKNTGKKLKRNNKGETTLHIACIKGDYELAKKLLEEGFDPDVKDNANWTPLHEASHHGHKNVVELLLNHSASVDSPGCDNYTALHDAVEQNQIECVKLLMMYGADLNKRTSQGFTALQLVQSKEMEEVLLNTESTVLKSSSSSSTTVDSAKSSEIQRNQLIIITCSGFHSDKKSWISKMVHNLKWKFSEDLDENVTHLIPLTNEKRLCVRTMKYMSSLLLGKWIVHIDWLEACSKNNGWVDEDDYEINGCVIHPDPSILHRARTNARLQLPKLFEGGNFYLSPKLPLPVKNDLTLLIKYGSGQISNRGVKVKLDELDDEDNPVNNSDPLNQSILNQSFSSITTITTTLYNADASSAFSCCCYIVVVPTLDDQDHGSTVNGKSSKKGKNCKDKNQKNVRKNVLYRIINKKLCHVTPAWIFECVSKLCIT